MIQIQALHIWVCNYLKSDFFKPSKMEGVPRLYTLELHQDDPAKCTSAKMRRMGLSIPITLNRIPRDSLVLNPYADVVLLNSDRFTANQHGLVVIDCSWKKASDVFRRRIKGVQRKLPALLAGNPTNYSKLSSLSSLEAMAASLYIMGFTEAAQRLLSIYKWGKTFFTLNREPLGDYARASTVQEIMELERSYFPQVSASIQPILSTQDLISNE